MQKRRRIIAIVLTAALSGTMLPANSLTMYAADKLSPAKSIRADVDKTKFTHKEWTGTDYTDVEGKKVTGEDVFGINREDATTTLIPYQDIASASAAVWDYNAREGSEYFKLLTGDREDWDLTVVQNQEPVSYTHLPEGMQVIDERDEAFKFSNGWTQENGSQYLNGTNAWAKPGSSFEVDFTGSKIYLVGKMCIRDRKRLLNSKVQRYGFLER